MTAVVPLWTHICALTRQQWQNHPEALTRQHRDQTRTSTRHWHCIDVTVMRMYLFAIRWCIYYYTHLFGHFLKSVLWILFPRKSPGNHENIFCVTSNTGFITWPVVEALYMVETNIKKSKQMLVIVLHKQVIYSICIIIYIIYQGITHMA